MDRTGSDRNGRVHGADRSGWDRSGRVQGLDWIGMDGKGKDGKGFKGAVRKAQAFVWDKERGLVTIINSSVL